MGLRARLDQLQGRANYLMSKAEWTLDDAKEALAMLMELITAVRDGLALGMYVEDHAVQKLAGIVLHGEGGYLPVKATIDLDYSNYPTRSSEFAGGPYDGKRYKMTDKQMQSKTIVLKDSELYVWDGYEFQHEGKVKDVSGQPDSDETGD